jgi:hypothetical protein
MPDLELHLAPPPDRSNPVAKFLIAGLAMIVAGVVVFMLHPRKAAEISVQKVDLYAPHTEFKAAPGDNKVIGAPASSEDDLYVVATLRITDKLRLPIFLNSTSATMTTAEGETIEAKIISPQDLPRLEQTLPEVLPLVNPPAAQPISLDDAVAPGTTRVGSVVLLFPQISAKAWQTKKSATLTLNLARDTAPQTVALP